MSHVEERTHHLNVNSLPQSTDEVNLCVCEDGSVLVLTHLDQQNVVGVLKIDCYLRINLLHHRHLVTEDQTRGLSLNSLQAKLALNLNQLLRVLVDLKQAHGQITGEHKDEVRIAMCNFLHPEYLCENWNCPQILQSKACSRFLNLVHVDL